MSGFVIAFALWMNSVGRQVVSPPQPPPPTVGVPKNEKPRNVRPWTPPVTTQQSGPGECPPEKK